MSSQLGEAFVPIRATLDKLDADLASARGKVSNALSGIAKTASGIGNQIQTAGKAVLGTLAGWGATAIGAAVGLAKLAASAEPLVGLQQGFAAVTERIGTSSKDMLAGLQAASGGLITNRDLMASFNKAAALVSDDFAEKLPDAMSLVRKASQATGQDMGFLFDSLVTGVGRVSPMILDNLGIQVQLAEVTDRAAQMFGKQADELSKTEQQAALTEIVMEKLNETYGDVPDASPTFAKFSVAIRNLKDEIGLKLLPVMAPLAEKLLGLAQKILPPLIDTIARLVIPTVQGVAEAIGKFIDLISGGTDPITAIQVLIMNLAETFGLGQSAALNLAVGVGNIIETIQGAIATVIEFLTPIIETVTQFVSWNDVLIALGILIASVVIPAIIGFIATLAPIIATVAAVIAVVALLRNAWENDWGGIRTALIDFWENKGKPALEALRTWLAENIPIAIKKLSDFWTNTLWPAIQNVWAFIRDNVIPLFIEIVGWLAENIPVAISKAANFWNNTLWPALQNIWSFIKEKVIPIFLDVVTWLGENIPVAIETAKGFWDNTLAPALSRVWQFIKEHLWPTFLDVAEWLGTTVVTVIETAAKFWKETLQPALSDVWSFIKTYLWPAFEDVAEWLDTTIGTAIETASKFWKETLRPAIEDVWKFLKDDVFPLFQEVGDYFDKTLGAILTAIAKGWDGITSAVGWLIDKVKEVIEWIEKAVNAMPDWLIPGSPTPFEIGLRGIAKGFKEISSLKGWMPDFGGLGGMMPALAIAGAESPGVSTSTSYSSTTQIYTNRDPLRVLRASRHLDKLGSLH